MHSNDGKHPRKQVIILDHNRGRLGNQLWNYVSIYAYCRERGYDLENPSFAAYARFFPSTNVRALGYRLLTSPLATSRIGQLFRPYYRYIRFIKKTRPHMVVESGDRDPFYLPPSETVNPSHQKILQKCESSPAPAYFDGWLFRNPVGLITYGTDIRNYFSPAEHIGRDVQEFLKPLRERYRTIVGVHIRQGDYRTWAGGRYFVEQKKVREILDSYLASTGQKSTDVAFVLCSDGPIEEKIFQGLSVFKGPGDQIKDLFVLAGSNLVIGSNSTFGAFAAYYGDIPIAVMGSAPIDWNAITRSRGYNFDNTCTLVHP